MTPLGVVANRTFRSLRIRNYKLYFIGQIVSFSGTWMQSVAQIWLVLQLTHNGLALGIVTALQFLPMLVAGAWGGVIADRFDKRTVLFWTQAVSATLAIILGILVATHVVQLWMVYVLAAALGCVTVVDNPTRQSFAVEMVGPDGLSNAIGLNSAIFTSSRVIGPALAGITIAILGVAPCFFLNALSYFAVISALKAMDTHQLRRAEPVPRAKGQLREAWHYVWSTPELAWPLFLMTVIGTLAFNFRVILPVMAQQTFHGGAGTYGLLSTMMGAGTVIGALTAASRTRPTRRMLVGSAMAYGVLILVAGAAPSLVLEAIALVPMGAAGIAFVSTANSTLQLNSAETMRGRVMALYAVVFFGSTPIGSPIAGWIAEAYGARAGFWLAGLATVAAAGVALWAVHNRRLPSLSPMSRDEARLATARAADLHASRSEPVSGPLDHVGGPSRELVQDGGVDRVRYG
jgi:MFS family permease